MIVGTDLRGKYLWLLLDTEPGSGSDTALVVHLGMSGQMLLGMVPRAEHVRISALLDDGTVLSFVDQRTFGGWMLADLVSVDGSVVPVPVAHIARDPIDPDFDDEAFVAAVRRRHTEIKRALLDQSLISGVGNIYADEALWRAKLHGARPTDALTKPAFGFPRPLGLEATSFEVARWVDADDPKLIKKFADANRDNIAEDHSGATVFLARNDWQLNRAKQDFPNLRFLQTREQAPLTAAAV